MTRRTAGRRPRRAGLSFDPLEFAIGSGSLPAINLELDIEHPFGMMRGPRPTGVTSDATRRRRKLKILHYIAATLRSRGYPPSVREIALAVGLSSTSAVHHHLQMLEREGSSSAAPRSRAPSAHADRGDRDGPYPRARARSPSPPRRMSCGRSARSRPAARSRRTRTPRRRWPSRTSSHRAATRTSFASAAIR
jgi:hypothetical protein